MRVRVLILLCMLGLGMAGAQPIVHKKTTALSTARQMYGSAVLGDYLYILGGHIGTGYTNSVEVAHIGPDGMLENWKPTTNMPSPLSYIGNQVISAGNTLYVVGGVDMDQQVKYNSIFHATQGPDGQLGSWTKSPEYPGQGVSSSVALSTPGCIHLVAGSTEEKTGTSLVWTALLAPDGSVAGWEPGPELPAAVWMHCGAVAAGYAWIWAGITNPQSEVYNDILYRAPVQADGRLGPWQKMPAGLPKPYYYAASGSLGDFLIAMCPRYSKTEVSDDVWFATAVPDGISDWKNLTTGVPPRLYLSIATDRKRGNVYLPGGRPQKSSYDMDPTVYFFPIAVPTEQEDIAEAPAATQSSAMPEATKPVSEVTTAAATAIPHPVQTEAPMIPDPAVALTQAAFPEHFITFAAAAAASAQAPRPAVLFFYNPREAVSLTQLEVIRTVDWSPFLDKLYLVAVDVTADPNTAALYQAASAPHWIFFDAGGQPRTIKPGVLSAFEIGLEAGRIMP